MTPLFFILANLVLVAASLFSLRLPEVHRKFSLTVLQTLLFLPLLVTEYLAVVLNFVPGAEGFQVVLASQNLFLILWSTAACRLRDAMAGDGTAPTGLIRFGYAGIVFCVLAVTVFQILTPVFTMSSDGIRFPRFGPIYLSSVICLLIMLCMAWQLEAFWRQLPRTRRREYGLFVVGIGLVCVVQGVVASYRLTYLELADDILFLQALFLLVAWLLLIISVLRHRLLNRKLFISRKIVYTFVAPTLFATYFLAIGGISLVSRLSGHPLESVLFWFLVGMGAVAMAILAISEAVRQRLKFFISTHFYVNKYEYRDEWLAFSALLQDAHDEAKVLAALRHILVDSLYTGDIWIWSGSETEGYGLSETSSAIDRNAYYLPISHPILRHLHQYPRLDLTAQLPAETGQACLASLPSPRPILFVPLIAGGQMVGCIGLGPEYTGGRYGQDDFDLLAALGSQAASALLVVRLAEEAARLREQRALNNLSAFLLHDIKNAASILSLVHANAEEHMDNPEFRKDMLVAISDALGRMDKVRTRLGLLRDQIEPALRDIDLRSFLEEMMPRFSRRLPGLDLLLDCPGKIPLRTDPSLLGTVIENLLLNAYEAGNGKTLVRITACLVDDALTLTVADDGSAIPEHLLPDRLFQPFVSDKEGGSGIGLWQAHLLLRHLGATITAENPTTGGASFVIRLPLVDAPSGAVGPADGV